MLLFEENPNLLLPPKERKLANKEEFEIMYSYEWRPEFAGQGSKLIDTSRDFCRDLLKRDMLYTKEEIYSLRNDFGTSVWKYKGGWYTKPGTDIHVPQCRHWWVQSLVKVK